MVHRIQDYKPSLRQHGLAVDTSDAKPALAYDSNSDIVMFSEESWFKIFAGWLKSGALFLVSAVLIFAVLYTTLAVSLFFTTFVEGKPVFVARGTFLGGEPALTDKILGSRTEASEDDPLNRLQYAFMGVPNSVVGEISSGPVDTISAANGQISISGSSSQSYEGVLVDESGQPQDVSSRKLQDEYLVKCMSGECQPGSYFLIKGESIFGEVQNVKAGN